VDSSPNINPGVIAERALALARCGPSDSRHREVQVWALNKALCSASDTSLVLAVHEIAYMWAKALEEKKNGG
jgi:hypothetical protein